jgi:aldose 1-epimerase
MISRYLATSLGFALLTASAMAGENSVTQSLFGKTADGKPVYLHKLTNEKGMSVSVSDLGATIVNIFVPDKKGHSDDVILGYDTLKPYFTNSPYLGTNPGRYANRIAKGKFTLDGKTYKLATNNGPNSLHGGIKGFDKYVWTPKVISNDPPTIAFSRVSPDGEEGYPGNLSVTITFKLDGDENALHISYSATTDKATVINLTNHCYFNLKGQTTATVLDDVIQIKADKMTPVDATLIPTGDFLNVAGTAYDFREPTPIGTHLHELSGKPVGYDYNYVLNKGTDFGTAAIVYDPTSGRTLTVKTNQPGVQFYTGNFLDGSIMGKHHLHYPQYSGFCLESQDFPDSPNQPKFPSVVLRPGSVYNNQIEYVFGVR